MKDNEVMKRYLDNKDHLHSLRPDLILEFSREFAKRNECEGEIIKIGGSEQPNDKNKDEIEKLKI